MEVQPSGFRPLSCDMTLGCQGAVTHIDRGGYLYCATHSAARRVTQSCRKLRAWELKKLQRGETLERY